MKQKTTSNTIKFVRILSFLLILLMGGGTFYGQTKEYATSQTSGKNAAAIVLDLISGGYNPTNTSAASVGNPMNAIDENETTFAVMNANNLNLLVAKWSGEAWLDMKFPNGVPANTTTYVKIDKPTATGFSLDLLETVGGLLGLLSENIIISEAYNNAGEALSNVYSTIAEDGVGNVYLAITPSQDYTSVRLKLRSQSNLLGLSLGGGLDLNVYEAFYYTDAPACGRPLYTYYEDSGLNIGLLEFQNRNLNNAIDVNENTSSQLKQGALLGVSVAGSQSQVFNFASSSSETATLNIKLLLGSGGVLNADLLGASEVILYNGAEKVYQRSLQSSLLNNTDLLELLEDGDPITMTFAPGRAFDRAEVRLTSPVGVNLLSDALKIYNVERFDGITCINPEIKPTPFPTVGPFEVPSCATTLIDFDNVDFASEAVDGNNETYATLYADTGSLLVSGPTAGFIEMDLGQTVPANKTTYVRINYDEDVLQKLVQGSLGKLVSDLANDLLLGNQYFEVEAKNGTASVLKEESSNAFEGNANGVVTLVQDNIGRYYIAITPSSSYNRIRITNHVKAVLPTGKKASLDVYNACFEIGTDSCFPANFTSYRGGGLNLTAANLTAIGVENPYRAISNNTSEYSKISLGLAGVAAHVYQTVYFSQPSEEEDYVKVRVRFEPSSVLSLDLLGSYKVRFFNGKTQVGVDHTLQGGSLINNIDLLGLFKAGELVDLKYTPTGTFDRVEIGIESIVSLNVAAEPLHVYNVARFGNDCPETTEESPFDLPSCATKLIDASNTDNVSNLLDDNFGSYATLNSGKTGLLGLAGSYEGFVELGYEDMVPAGTTSYIRIDFDESLLKQLVGGSLGNIVTGLLDGLLGLAGEHFFEVDVKNNTYNSDGSVASSIPIATAKSNEASAGGNNAIRVVRDKEGRYYIAVTPNAEYNAVRITNKTNSALQLSSDGKTMNVYGMCYETSADCEEAFITTSYEYTGLSLSVTNLSGSGVTNPQYAIDDNSTHYSEISMGTLNLVGGVKQWIFLNREMSASEAIQIKFKVGTGAVDVALLGDLKIQAYLGNELVNTLSWGTNGIINGVNVLDLINNGGIVDLPYTPGAAFDRITVGIENLVSASVFPPVQLYGVDPCYTLTASEFVAWKSADKASVKGGEEVEYTIHVRNTGAVDIHNMTIEDKLPVNTTYVSGGTFADGKVTFPALDVLVGETKTVTFKVKVNNDLTGVTEIRNIATVNGEDTFPSLPDNPSEPDTSAEPGTIIPVEQIKSVVSWKAYEVGGDKTKTAVSGGEEVEYHIYVRNTGNQDLTNVVVTDELPEGVTWKSGGTHVNGQVTFTIPNLKVGATSSAQNFSVTVNNDLTNISEIKNIAVVQPDPDSTETEESFPPVDNGNPTEPDTDKDPGTVLEVTPNHDVEISKVGVSNNANNGQAQIGDEVTYTITVKNTGNKTLTDLWITDVLPTNFKDVAAQEGLVADNTVTLLLPTLAVNEVKTLTITATVDSMDDLTDNKIVNTAEVTYRNEAGDGDITETATHEMNTSCIAINAGDITITTDKQFVCAEDEFTITATTSINGLVDPVFRWYTNADLSGMPIIGDALIRSVTETTTFYVTLEADGYCFNTPPQEITITVEPEAGIPTITIDGNNNSVCEGETVILKATANNASSYQWYKDGNEISGATEATYAASESGSYTVTALNASGCDSEKSASVEVTILPLPEKPTITPDGSVEICEGEFVTLEASEGDLYEWYYNGTVIEFPVLSDPNDPNSTVTMETRTDKQSIEVNEAGDYTVIVINNNGCKSIESDVTTISVNPTPVLTVTGSQMIYVAKGATIPWPTVSTDVIQGTIEWYHNGTLITQLPTSLPNEEVYTYTAVSESGTCYAYENIIVTVYDDEGCPPVTQRIYANDESWGSIITGGVSNRGNAVDGSPKTYSTITTGVGLLGIGTTWQTLYFNKRGEEPIPAGTPVTIKLGKEYSGVAVAGGISVVGVRRDGLGTPIDIGVLKPVEGGLLDLLVADNVVEYTFVPSTISGAKDYDGVRISQGALLSVAQNAKVYGAYITKPGSASCNPIDSITNPNVIDVLHGVRDVGLGVATGLSPIANPWSAVDTEQNTNIPNETTFAVVANTLKVLAAQHLTVVFDRQVMPTDQLSMVYEFVGNPVLDLSLIKGFKIQRYLRDQKVGPVVDGELDILSLTLLGIGYKGNIDKLFVNSFNEPYDRVEISFGHVVGVADGGVRIYDVSIAPTLDYGQIDDEDFELCPTGPLVFEKMDDCTIYEVYTTIDGTEGWKTEDGLSFELPEDLAAGEHTIYVQAIRQGCEIGSRQEIKITILPLPELQGYEVSINKEPASTFNPIDTPIEVSPTDIVEISPTIDWSTSTMGSLEWEMQNPIDADEWMNIPFGEVSTEGDLKLTIPAFGQIELPNGSMFDIRNETLKIRVTITSEEGCSMVHDLELKIDGRSKMIINPNVTNKLK